MAVALILLMACGGGSDAGDSGGGNNVTDLSQLETKLVELQKEKSPDLNVEGAECPPEVDLEQGSSFECTVTIEGVAAPYSVTLTEDDPEAEAGSFHVEPAKAIIDVSIVTEFISSQAGGGEAECGSEKVIVSDVGGTFDCTVSIGGQTQDVEMIVKDIDGTVAVNS
jgi:hypothetical protein